MDWFQFEKIVALAYRRQGYRITRRGGARPDGGIDLILERDGQTLAVRCKQWKARKVRAKTVREFLGALSDSNISQGVLVSLRGGTADARQLAERHAIAMVDETGLARMLADKAARFDPEALELLNDRRKYCPVCEAEMQLRTARRGSTADRQFWGCSNYPSCLFTMAAAARITASR